MKKIIFISFCLLLTMSSIAAEVPDSCRKGNDEKVKDLTYDEGVIINGVYGRKFTDKFTDNSIFLPATGTPVMATMAHSAANVRSVSIGVVRRMRDTSRTPTTCLSKAAAFTRATSNTEKGSASVA